MVVSFSAHLMHGIDRVANCTVEHWHLNSMITNKRNCLSRNFLPYFKFRNTIPNTHYLIIIDTLNILTFLIVSVSAHLMHGIDRVANCTVELWQFCGWDATSPEGFGTSYKIWPHFWKHITAKTKQKKSRIITASSLAQPATTAGKHLWHTWNNSISRGGILRR